MIIPTEPIGSIPRPLELIEAISARGGPDPTLDSLVENAIRDTIDRFEATGSAVIADGEQRKYHNFWTYCVQGLTNTAPDGFKIPFAAGHVRRMLRLTGGPFRYNTRADTYLEGALRHAHVPVKQAVISPSALSLMYPADELGTTDDCGFAPFCDDTSTTRDKAFEKIRARVLGTALAGDVIRGRQ